MTCEMPPTLEHARDYFREREGKATGDKLFAWFSDLLCLSTTHPEWAQAWAHAFHEYASELGGSAESNRRMCAARSEYLLEQLPITRTTTGEEMNA